MTISDSVANTLHNINATLASTHRATEPTATSRRQELQKLINATNRHRADRCLCWYLK